MKTLAAWLSAAAMAAMAAACAACADDGDARYPHDAGWRVGTVEAMAPAGSLPGNGCDGAPPFDHAVYVRYYAGMRPRRTVVAVLPDAHWAAGQRLRFNVEDCRRPAVALPD